MRLPKLFGRENSDAAKRERQDRAERIVTEGLRTLADLMSALADRIEERRLARSGYEEQGKFLERTPSRTDEP